MMLARRAASHLSGCRCRDHWRAHAVRDPKRRKQGAAVPPPPSPLPPVVVAGAAGAILGPLLDGIHSSVGLQIYDLYPVDILDNHLHTSLLVPPLLASFYVVLSSLDAAAEQTLAEQTPADQTPTPPPPALGNNVAACYASLAAGLALSASLHSVGTAPPAAIAACLALFAAGNWWLFDRSGRGLALALLCALVAPLAEAELMARFGAWHYPRADVSVPVLFSGAFLPAGASPLPPAVGFVSWVPLCYFFYAPSVLLLGRKLRAARRERREEDGVGTR